MKYIKFKFLTFFIVLISVIFSIFLCELVLRFIGLGDPVIYEKNPSWGYSLSENQTRVRFKNNVIKVNNVGLRSDKEWVKTNNKLILFMGDSVTYGGSKIDNTELFSEKVCKHLGKKFLCGNAGINGYGVLNMVLRSRYDDRINNADIVIFVVILDDFWRGLVDIEPKHYFISSPNKILPAMEEALNYAGWRYDINRYLAHKIKPNLDKVSKKNKMEKENKAHFNTAEFALQNLNQEISRLISKEKKVFVFYSPAKTDVIGDTPDWRKKIEKEVLNKTTNIYDMTPKFRENLELSIHSDNIHYTVDGHSLAAKIIHEYLKDNLN